MAPSKVFWARLLLLPLSLALLSVAAYGQQQGFLSIDCGKPAGYNYTDSNTGLLYVSDSGYVDAGESHKISSSYTSSTAYSHSLDVRSFPNVTRGCYTLPVIAGSRYVVRAWFQYGNYDGTDRLPEFDLYVDMFRWGSTKIRNASIAYYAEMVAVASSGYMSVCVVETGKGVPFVSAVEMRPLPDNLYLEADASSALVGFYRIDFGLRADLLSRYSTDPYDRIWTPYPDKASWTQLQAASDVNVNNGYQPPRAVMATAVAPSDGSTLNLTFTPSSRDPPPRYHIFLHFAELQLLSSNQSRIFNISLNSNDFFLGLQPSYLILTTIITPVPKTYDRLDLSLYQAKGSTLPPIINALEIYIVTTAISKGTHSDDVAAVMGVKSYYRLRRNWMGDPCNPKEFVWEGLTCAYATNRASRITSLMLSSSRLDGEISPSIGNLKELQHLDLSMNNLTGKYPDFLASLPNLTYLNLTGNSFSGEIPKLLRDRAAKGTLTLDIGDTQNVTDPTDSGKEKKNDAWKIAVAVVGVVVFASLSLVIIFVVMKAKRSKREQAQGQEKWQQGSSSFRIPSFRGENRQFMYGELRQITRNFNKIIGRGGFGIVYYGELENGRPVAVKVLSKSSSQGPKEFQTEAQLLSRIYHKNLVALVGYCKDKDDMVLVYEYMAKGNLATILSEEGQTCTPLSWSERVRIAMEAAQGVDYLHRGCRPAIIHRDIKASNILLNEQLEAKMADFGLSRMFGTAELEQSFVSTVVMGTLGYLDPEYSNTGKLNEKSDVYSFGVVLLELITGKPAIVRGPTTPVNLVKWVEPLFASGDIEQIVDPRFRGEYESSSMWKALEMAMACVAESAIQRPAMSDVASSLKDCYELESGAARWGRRDATETSSVAAMHHAVETSSMLQPSAR